MTSPNLSLPTYDFSSKGVYYIDALLYSEFVKWGGSEGVGASLSFSFPWKNGESSYWQDSYGDEPFAATRFGFNSTQIEATRSALQAWSNVANLTFTEISESSSNVGDFRFAFSSEVGDNWWGHSTYPNDYWARAADVWVDPNESVDSWAIGDYNYEALMHEIGHGLGLKHPGNYGEGGTPGPYLPSGEDSRLYTIMSYNDPENYIYPSGGYVNGNWEWITYQICPETPMVCDIAAIQYLYGANLSYHSGNDTYTFDPSTPFFKTIWDGGGNDTISVSNFTLSCTLDLTPGHYSSIHFSPPRNTGGVTVTYDGSDNLGIAYGCSIENAIGGSGNDRFIGNTANNKIDGMGGTDQYVFSGTFSQYTVVSYQGETNTLVVRDQIFGRDGTDALTNIESYVFSDSTKTLAQLISNLPDTSRPSVISFSPADEAAGVAVDSNIVVTFNEAIQRGSGNIALKTAGGATVAAYDAATSTNLSIYGNTLTINPTASLANGTAYKVEFAASTIRDLAGNSFAGTASYNFTTAQDTGDRFEDNDTAATATNLGTIQDSISVTSLSIEASDPDWYKFTLSSAGRNGDQVTLDFIHGLGDIDVEIYDDTGITFIAESGGTSNQEAISLAGFEPGDYLIKVFGYGYASNPDYTLDVATTFQDNPITTGTTGKDLFSGGSGLTIDGLTGIDTATYQTYFDSITHNPDGSYSVGSTIVLFGYYSSRADTLINVERLQFADRNIALDLAPSDNAGQALLFIGVLAHDLIASPEIVGMILGYFDGGMNMQELNQLAIDVGLVSSLAGGGGNADVARLAYENVIGAAATADVIDMLVSYMDGRNASYSQSEFLMVVANLDVNQAHVDLVGVAQTGVEYLMG